MENARLHLGYRRMDYQGISLRGHEFHYSSIAEPDTLPSVTPLYNVKGTEVSTPLYRYQKCHSRIHPLVLGRSRFVETLGLNQLKLMQNQKLHPVMLAGTGSDVGKKCPGSGPVPYFSAGRIPSSSFLRPKTWHSIHTPPLRGWRSDVLRPFRLKPQAYPATQI